MTRAAHERCVASFWLILDARTVPRKTAPVTSSHKESLKIPLEQWLAFMMLAEVGP